MIIARIISLVIGYILGTFQTGYIYGKTKHIDIREHGSGNSGTTNTLRTLGWKAGIITFLGDSLKAVLTVHIIYFLYRNAYPDSIKLLELYGGFGAVLGHNFPVQLNFKGGKGIACTAGVVVTVFPQAAPICAILFFGALLLTRYVSLGSLLMASAFLIQGVVLVHMGLVAVAPQHMIEFDIVLACFTAMAFWRHRANIVRLIHGTENKFGSKKDRVELPEEDKNGKNHH